MNEAELKNTKDLTKKISIKNAIWNKNNNIIRFTSLLLERFDARIQKRFRIYSSELSFYLGEG